MPVTVQGHTGCECIQRIVPLIEKDLLAVGAITGSLGGYVCKDAYVANDGTTTSAGTHSGGGVWDFLASLGSDTALRIFRKWGWWVWYRPAIPGTWDSHCHGVVIGCPHLSSEAQKQQVDAYAGKNGLANHGPDNGPSVPVVTFQQALANNGQTPAQPTVSLSRVKAAAAHDIPAPTGSKSYPADVLPVEKALSKEGLLLSVYVDGSFGSKTKEAYASWQRRLGYVGAAADGIPGMLSLSKLGNKYGFKVVS